MFVRRRSCLVALAAIFGSGVLAASCGDGGNSATPTVPAPPAATATPSPPSGPSGSTTCALGEGSRTTSCEETFSELSRFVETAMDRLIEEQPELFDLSMEKGIETRQYLVLDKEAYLDGIVGELSNMGLCAGRSNADYEIIQVKNSNDFSEDYDVHTSDGFMRRGGAYRQTCSPASFPLARDPNAPPRGSGCGVPYPPPISRLNIHLQYKGSEYDTLDATALVGHDVQYCAAIGFTDGRSLCPVRPEGHPERVACENWAVGKAEDTGRYGPTWYNPDGEFCTGGDSGCRKADNQYKLWVWKSGRYKACAQNGACGYEDYVR